MIHWNNGQQARVFATTLDWTMSYHLDMNWTEPPCVCAWRARRRHDCTGQSIEWKWKTFYIIAVIWWTRSPADVVVSLRASRSGPWRRLPGIADNTLFRCRRLVHFFFGHSPVAECEHMTHTGTRFYFGSWIIIIIVVQPHVLCCRT